MSSRRSALLLVVVWVVGAVVATTVGVLAVRQVRSDVGDPAGQPLTASDVQRAVRRASPAAVRPPAPSPTAGTMPPAPAPAATRRTFQSSGGTVAVQCSGNRASLVYVLPAAGWAVVDTQVERDRLEVVFGTGDQETETKVSCSAAGVPESSGD